MIASIGFAIYAACVDFLLQASSLIGISYRDANSILFFVLWPFVTLVLIVTVLTQAIALRRAAPR